MLPEQVSHIGAYMQFDRKIHEQQGSGMGLIIASRLAELYAGRLSIDSVSGEGTQVCFELPA